ncbi:heterokaryon incompatibility protein-domain-containing protein, partial [Leptodontidium sp. 2 PMI_412]
MWNNGHLVFNTEAEPKSSESIAKVVPPQFEPRFVLDLLSYCNNHHQNLCRSQLDLPKTRLIDCYDRSIIFSSQATKYVTLSYVWSQNQTSIPRAEENMTAADDWVLPSVVSQAIEGAIQVTKKLGYRYLWVDKYCIDQKNELEKLEQIGQMDMIYQASEFTIVAAAGYDEHTGLPGVGSTTRSLQPSISLGEFTIRSTMRHPHQAIKAARWMTRGWTLQESILAKRRLVFTEDQIYFECNAMNCYE